jgi:hypothetical protein
MFILVMTLALERTPTPFSVVGMQASTATAAGMEEDKEIPLVAATGTETVGFETTPTRTVKGEASHGLS